MEKYFLVLAACLIFLCVERTESCSCMPAHPQQHFCDSDFVILARIKFEKISNGTREYKIRIRKRYKMSEKADMALKHGRLLTPVDESMCGVQLQTGKLYAISGRIISLQARINYCGFTEQWEHLTKRQRKGLKLMYKQGCACDITFCPPHKRCARRTTSCNWETWSPMKKNDCQRNEGICLRSASNQCMWSKTASMLACTRNSTVMHYEPKEKKQKKFNSPFHDGPGKKFGRSRGKIPFRPYAAAEPNVRTPKVYPNN